MSRGMPQVFRHVLTGNPNYLLLLSGQVVSSMGERVALVAVSWWILEITGRPELLAVAMMFSTLSTVFLSPVAGILADRFHRVRILVFTDLVRGMVMVSLAYLEWTGALTLVILYAGMGITGAATALFTPTSTALVPNIVGRTRLVQANSMFQMSTTLAGVVGPALGGVVLLTGGVAGSFLVTGLAFALSAVWEALIRVSFRPAASHPSVWDQLGEGFRYVASHRLILRMFMTFAFINFFSTPLSPVLVPSVVKSVLEMSQLHMGFALSAMFGGIMASSLVLGLFGHHIKTKSRILLGALLVIGLGLAGMGVSVSGPMISGLGLTGAYALFVSLGFVTGLAVGVANINITTFMQETVPDAKRGRVFGLTTTMALGIQPAAAGFVALILGYMDEAVILSLGGMAVALGAIYLSRSPEIREI